MASNLNRAGLITESSTLFPDNNTQEISPQDLRDWIADGTTSFVTQKDKSTLENAIYENDSTPLAAGSTVDLSTATGNFVHITGAATITSFGTLTAGARFVLVFDGICLLTYNATSLIIPGSANKTTAAGDACMIISEGSGNWRIVGYFAISGSGGAGITALTGDVTASGSGSVAATIANGAVDIPMLSATGTPSGTTFLRGDNTWATPTGGGSPGGLDTEIQYNNGGAFGGVSDLVWDDGTNTLTIKNPRIGQSTGNGHFHMHTINASAPSGITDYITVYADKSPKQIGARFETDAYTSAIQFGATADRTYSLPDASGNVVIDTATQTLTNKTLTSPSITTPAITTPAITGIATIGNGTSAGEIRLLEPSGSGSNYVALKAQAMASNYDLILPASAGTVGNFLQYGTGGNLSWGNPNPYGFFKSLKVLGLGTGVNSTTITLSNSLYIPAGTFVANDMVTIYARFYKSSASLVRNYTNYIYVNTVNSVVSGSPILLATAFAGAAQVNGELIRELSVLSSGVSGQSIIKNTTSPTTDWSNYVLSSFQLSILTIDWSVDQYLIHAMNQSATTVTEFGYSYGLSITGR